MIINFIKFLILIILGTIATSQEKSKNLLQIIENDVNKLQNLNQGIFKNLFEKIFNENKAQSDFLNRNSIGKTLQKKITIQKD